MKQVRNCHTCKYRENGFGQPCASCFTKIRGPKYPNWKPRTYKQCMEDKNSHITGIGIISKGG